jgi:hypothetical protein
METGHVGVLENTGELGAAGDAAAASVATYLALMLWAQFDWLGWTPEFVQGRAAWFVALPSCGCF